MVVALAAAGAGSDVRASGVGVCGLEGWKRDRRWAGLVAAAATDVAVLTTPDTALSEVPALPPLPPLLVAGKLEGTLNDGAGVRPDGRRVHGTAATKIEPTPSALAYTSSPPSRAASSREMPTPRSVTLSHKYGRCALCGLSRIAIECDRMAIEAAGRARVSIHRLHGRVRLRVHP